MYHCQHCLAEWRGDQLITIALLVSTDLGCPTCRGPVKQIPPSELQTARGRRWLNHDRGRIWTIIAKPACPDCAVGVAILPRIHHT